MKKFTIASLAALYMYMFSTKQKDRMLAIFSTGGPRAGFTIPYAHTLVAETDHPIF